MCRWMLMSSNRANFLSVNGPLTDDSVRKMFVRGENYYSLSAFMQRGVYSTEKNISTFISPRLIQLQSRQALRSSPRAFCCRRMDALLPTPSRPISAADPARPQDQGHRARCDRRRGREG